MKSLDGNENRMPRSLRNVLQRRLVVSTPDVHHVSKNRGRQLCAGNLIFPETVFGVRKSLFFLFFLKYLIRKERTLWGKGATMMHQVLFVHSSL